MIDKSKPTSISDHAVFLAGELSQIHLNTGDSLVPWQVLIQAELNEAYERGLSDAKIKAVKFLLLKRIFKFVPLYISVRKTKTCLSMKSCWILAQWKAEGRVMQASVQGFGEFK